MIRVQRLEQLGEQLGPAFNTTSSWSSHMESGIWHDVTLACRGWVEVEDEYDEDWDVYWASVGSIKQIFAQDGGIRLLPGQMVNHFPNHFELTRKVSSVHAWRMLTGGPGASTHTNMLSKCHECSRALRHLQLRTGSSASQQEPLQ